MLACKAIMSILPALGINWGTYVKRNNKGAMQTELICSSINDGA